MGSYSVMRLLAVGCLAVLLGACAVATPKPEVVAPPKPEVVAPPPPLPEVTPPPAVAPVEEKLPEVFESEDFVVTIAKEGDTPEELAAKFLGDPSKAWMIEEYNGAASFSPGQEVMVPKRPWNLSGVYPTGYQLVPVLVYHNMAPEAKGRLTIAVKTFEEQMRYLKAQGYRVISLNELLEFNSLRRQLSQKSVVVTFDDGYKSFLQYAYPILKELGFTATLFVYTDYVGAGRNALSWDDLKRLAQEGFQIEAHSKTHDDLRRRPEESDADFARRMQAELAYPLTLFQRHLARSSPILAYPYGKTDDKVIQKVKEYGYTAALTVLRQGNASFVYPLTLHRSQVYSEMSLEDFAKNLNTFNQEALE